MTDVMGVRRLTRGGAAEQTTQQQTTRHCTITPTDVVSISSVNTSDVDLGDDRIASGWLELLLLIILNNEGVRPRATFRDIVECEPFVRVNSFEIEDFRCACSKYLSCFCVFSKQLHRCRFVALFLLHFCMCFLS